MDKINVIFVTFILLVLNSYSVDSSDSPHAWRHTGKEYAYYNETCSSVEKGGVDDENSEPQCDPSKNLTCTKTNRCDCKKDLESSILYTPDLEFKGCSAVSQSKQVEVDMASARCLTHAQCRESIFGPLSRCNDNSRCECYDSITNGQKEVVLINRRCQYFQNYGDTCETDHECNGTIPGEAVCDQLGTNPGKKICVCHFDYVWDNKLQECVKIADTGLNFICRSDLQCSHPKALGQLSRCSADSRRCECFDIDSNGKLETALHPSGKCLYQRKINETCDNIEECKLGGGPLAICKKADINNSTKTCHCKEGYVWGPTREQGIEDCLPIGAYHSPCSADQQCYHETALGELSTCAEIVGSRNPRQGQCECWDTRHSGDQETGFYQGKCYFKRTANQTCNSIEECIVGYHANAICTEHPSVYMQKLCLCPEDKTCSAAEVLASLRFILITLIFSYIYNTY